LQKDGGTQAGGEDEMSLQQGAAFAEDVEYLVSCHAGSFSALPAQSIVPSTSASSTVARCTSERPEVSFRVEITSVSCARSRTSISKMNLWKSGEAMRIDKLWMLASQAAMALDTWASMPGLLRAIMEMTTLCGRSSWPATSQRTSIQATSESCRATSALEWIG